MDQNARGLPEWSIDFRGASLRYLNDYYDYDQNGNVAAISDALPDHRGDRTMTYDGLDRLKTVASPMYGTNGATYAYDALDNLTRVIAPGRDHYYCYDGNWQLTNVKTGGCSTGTSVTGLGYDVQGNLANKNGVIHAFDQGNRLRSVTGGSTASTYVYDGHGRRVRDIANGSKYSLYDRGGQLAYANDLRKGKSSVHVALAGSLVAIQERDNATGVVSARYQHTDALGTPVAVTDANRNVLERSEYEPYGQVLNRPVSDGPGYTGHVMDAATGLAYMQQRYYDPSIGGFVSVDPVAVDTKTGWNFCRYCYANNNPYKFTDPDGREAPCSIRIPGIRWRSL